MWVPLIYRSTRRTARWGYSTGSPNLGRWKQLVPWSPGGPSHLATRLTSVKVTRPLALRKNLQESPCHASLLSPSASQLPPLAHPQTPPPRSCGPELTEPSRPLAQATVPPSPSSGAPGPDQPALCSRDNRTEPTVTQAGEWRQVTHHVAGEESQEEAGKRPGERRDVSRTQGTAQQRASRVSPPPMCMSLCCVPMPALSSAVDAIRTAATGEWLSATEGRPPVGVSPPGKAWCRPQGAWEESRERPGRSPRETAEGPRGSHHPRV